MTFLSTPLPPCISAGSDGTPSFSVDVARGPSGYEQRISRRGFSLRKFNVGYHIRRTEQLADIVAHFEVCEGKLHTFPFLDRMDHKSCGPFDEPAATDVLLGVGDGSQAEFQLRKGYTRGSSTVYRTIQLPIEGTVLIAVNGSPQTESSPSQYSIDYETGIVTFGSGDIPAAMENVTAGFQYRCKVRFDTDDLTQTYEGFHAGGIASIPLIEVRE